MVSESFFRVMFAIILVAAFGMSGFFRRRARQSGAIPRSREGGRTMFLRLLFAAPFYLAMVAYLVNPRWMDWSALVVPKEEAQLVEKFGGAYRAYQERTGGLLPRIPAQG